MHVKHMADWNCKLMLVELALQLTHIIIEGLLLRDIVKNSLISFHLVLIRFSMEIGLDPLLYLSWNCISEDQNMWKAGS